MAPIKDSGERTQFESGAVRDMHEGKGDIASIPWESVLRLSRHYEAGAKNISDGITGKEYQFQVLSIPLAGTLQSTNAGWMMKIIWRPPHLIFWAQC